MFNTNEIPQIQRYTKGQIQKRLNISWRKYKQWIESGLLAQPIKLTDGSFPFHTESQAQDAERELLRRVHSFRPQLGKPIKPIWGKRNK